MTADTTHEQPKPDQFGGPIGALVLTIVMPVASFYLWSAVAHHGGSMWLPTSLDAVIAMFPLPTLESIALLGAWLAIQFALYVFGPGPVVQGRPAHNGEQAEYRINGLFAFAVSTVALVAALYFELFSAKWVLSQWGPMLTLCTLFAVGAAAWSHVAGRRRGALERSTGNGIYDFFLGTILNPRLGRHDLKFFFESRVGMGIWAAFAVILPAAQLEMHGSLSTAMVPP